MVGEQTQNVALDSKIVGDDMQPHDRSRMRRWLERPVSPFVPLIDAFGRNDLGKIHSFETGKFLCETNRGLRIYFVARHDAARLGAFLAQNSRELASVDVGNRNHFAALEKIFE